MSIFPRLVHTNVRTNRPLDRPDFVELVLAWPDSDYKPGQFVMIRPESWSNDPLLPRPFSIAGVDSDGLHLFIQVVGKGTRLLASLQPGEELSVWGPLGNGFFLDESRPALLLAGGMGIAPFVGLVQKSPGAPNRELVFGHRAPLSCYPFHILSGSIQAEAHQQESMEDIQEFLTYIRDKMAGYVPAGQVLACGPSPFLKAIQEMALDLGVDAQLSLERRMACGVGACLGCVVEKKGEGPVQSCTKGPVFRADEIVL
ncbi:MAG: dihydroorotate dehydrogenase electron transfer subunit [Desulfovibrionales bacterium]